jgi:hypothetical protein
MAIVYLSSTKVDLDDERERIIRLLVDAQHDVRHGYRAAGDPLVATCLKDVGSCSVYLLLCGRRYGFRPAESNPEQLSITQLEFRAARDAGKELVVLEQARPPIELSDADQGRVADDLSRKAFWEEIRKSVVPGRWIDEATLNAAVLNGINDAVKRLEARRLENAPAITPGVSRPHPRLLSRALLLLHLGGDDEALAARLAGALGDKAVGWPVELCRVNPEDGIDWREFDRKLSLCRAAAVLLTDSAPRFGPDGATLRRLLDFARRQCGFAAGFFAGASEANAPWLAGLELSQRYDLNEWAAGTTSALTPDLAQTVKHLRTRLRDIEDPKLVGLQCVVVAMTRSEAQDLRDKKQLAEQLNEEQRKYLEDALAHLKATGTDWLARYGDTREDWQPFGPAGETRRPALTVLREVAEEINRQPVVPRRDAEALLGHRIRLRPYAFEPLVAEDPDALKLMEQVMARRVLVLVDELSLCHPAVRAAAADPLSDPHVVVATVAPFDPPALPVEAALKGNSVLQLGNLKRRFLVAMDPQCELNLASNARLMRWLAVDSRDADRGVRPCAGRPACVVPQRNRRDVTDT